MQPTVSLNWLAIVAAVIANFAIGSVWYGVLFRDAWQRSMAMAAPPTSGDMVRGSVISIVGIVLTAIALAWIIGGWRPTAWGLPGADGSRFLTGLAIGLIAWIGFMVPAALNTVAYERSNWTRFGIGAAYQFVALLVMALIIALWR